MGFLASIGVVICSLAYCAALAWGLMTLPFSDAPIGGIAFLSMEVLILLIAPLIVLQMVGLVGDAREGEKQPALAALVFAALLAGTTSTVHFAILTLAHQPEFAQGEIGRLLFAFRWPSVAYALDILAWDLFFPLMVFFAAGSVRDKGPVPSGVRILLVLAGMLSLAGLAGALTGDMTVRNVGIAGYALVYPSASALIAVLFRNRARGRRPGTVHTASTLPPH